MIEKSTKWNGTVEVCSRACYQLQTIRSSFYLFLGNNNVFHLTQMALSFYSIRPFVPKNMILSSLICKYTLP